MNELAAARKVIEALTLTLQQTSDRANALERDLAAVSACLDARTRGIKAIAAHWREFGPDHGFDEVVETVAYAVELSGDYLMSAKESDND